MREYAYIPPAINPASTRMAAKILMALLDKSFDFCVVVINTIRYGLTVVESVNTMSPFCRPDFTSA